MCCTCVLHVITELIFISMIVSGDIDKIETLASEHTASDIVAAIEGDGDVPSPIHRAAQYGHAESIKAMIKASNKTALVNQASIK